MSICVSVCQLDDTLIKNYRI